MKYLSMLILFICFISCSDKKINYLLEPSLRDNILEINELQQRNRQEVLFIYKFENFQLIEFNAIHNNELLGFEYGVISKLGIYTIGIVNENQFTGKEIKIKNDSTLETSFFQNNKRLNRSIINMKNDLYYLEKVYDENNDIIDKISYSYKLGHLVKKVGRNYYYNYENYVNDERGNWIKRDELYYEADSLIYEYKVTRNINYANH
ncbi:hypothetical protein EI427_24665 [Flammeovirga pectinis]|uniref:Uncharacterized protein n=1 Tax=Flammeovirga pectinis TaxID=2494373 RepID=A0A3S9PB51_9BACT|nr:hypothetical protein [Flammeovirga pectinis]AZQ65407.1 hypothetical protein EI427_24665 [Flammeovirga pectinis]